MDEKILIVEDSVTQAMLLENILKKQHYQVSLASNASDALKWLSENKPDLVISDIIMPGMNGFDLCREIKTNPTTLNISVILLTSLNGTDELIEGLSAGADSFITKPFDQDYFIQHIAKILSTEPLKDSEKKTFGMEITFEGKKRIIQAEQQQMIKLLLNIYEGSIEQNKRLLEAQENLKTTNDYLEVLVEERTAELSDEIKTRKKIEEKLKESEESLTFVLQGSQLGYWDWNMETNEVKRNKRWAEMIGYQIEDIEFTVNQWIDFIHPEDQALASKSIEDHLNGLTPMHRMEYRMRTKDGSYKWILDQAQAVKWNTEGKIIRMSGTHTDITNQKLAEDLLHLEQLFTNSLLDNLPGLFYLYSYPDMQLVRWNKNHETLLGYEKHELQNWKVTDWIDSNTRNYILEAADKIIDQGNFVFEAELHTKDHFPIPFILNGIRLDLQDKKYIMGFGIDSTDLRQAEDAIKLKNEELLKLNAEKDKFFSIIAHDLRSPLSAFLGFTEMMVDDLPHMKFEDLQEMAISMKSSAESLYRLLENLLQWAKIQRELVPFDPEVLSLLRIVNESINMIQESSKKKGIEIRSDISEELEVLADSNMLQTVMRNLISNAIKFTPQGGKISLSSKIVNSNLVEVSFKDNGIGMGPALQKDLFEINSKTNRKGTNGEPSSGLGLVLCKEFVEKLGGKITVKSEEGKGSEFSFTIPLHVKPEHQSDLFKQENVPAVLIHKGGLKILIADDDEGSGRLISLIVRSFASNIIRVRNGVEEVQAFKDNPDIDLIITDIHMPKMDGYEAAKQIRQLNSKVTIIALTDFAQTGERKIARIAGCTDYITKPFRKDKLIALISKYFKI